MLNSKTAKRPNFITRYLTCFLKQKKITYFVENYILNNLYSCPFFTIELRFSVMRAQTFINYCVWVVLKTIFMYVTPQESQDVSSYSQQRVVQCVYSVRRHNLKTRLFRSRFNLLQSSVFAP